MRLNATKLFEQLLCCSFNLERQGSVMPELHLS